MSKVLPFPVIRRRDFIARQAARMAASSRTDAAERWLEHVVNRHRETLLRKGVEPSLVARECKALASAMRAQVWNIVLRGDTA